MSGHISDQECSVIKGHILVMFSTSESECDSELISITIFKYFLNSHFEIF